jgi:hypothetical protein
MMMCDRNTHFNEVTNKLTKLKLTLVMMTFDYRLS